jgi:predicted ATP-dependent serine protease
MPKKKWKCKYCGTDTPKYSDICSNCRTKLILVRKLLQMVRDTFEMYGKGK